MRRQWHKTMPRKGRKENIEMAVQQRSGASGSVAAEEEWSGEYHVDYETRSVAVLTERLVTTGAKQ